MKRTVVLVLLDSEDADARAFSNALERPGELCERLRGRVDLRFARGDAAPSHAAEAEVMVGGHVSEALLAAAPKLRWIAYWSAGMDGKVTPALRERNLLLTNASGVHGPNIAEHVLAWMLMFARSMPEYLDAQRAGEWRQAAGAFELTGQTLGIIGLGRIGEAMAVRARAFGMRVVAAKRDPSARYDMSVALDALYGLDGVDRLLAESDHVCLAVPYTPATHHLMDAARLARMKPTAYLYNIGRGRLIDQAALEAALREKRIAGAGLDVFAEEPLPPASPLWPLPNVLITPHVAGQTPAYFTRVASLFLENLARYQAGESLHNLYRPDLGY